MGSIAVRTELVHGPPHVVGVFATSTGNAFLLCMYVTAVGHLSIDMYWASPPIFRLLILLSLHFPLWIAQALRYL